MGAAEGDIMVGVTHIYNVLQNLHNAIYDEVFCLHMIVTPV